MDDTRLIHLGRTLREHRRKIQDEIRNRIRDGRSERPQEVGDDLDCSDAGMQGDIDLALLQMRTKTLGRIDVALRRLEAGDYGICVECAREIAERRLQALPFAERCQACEGRRERTAAPSRIGFLSQLSDV